MAGRASALGRHCDTAVCPKSLDFLSAQQSFFSTKALPAYLGRFQVNSFRRSSQILEASSAMPHFEAFRTLILIIRFHQGRCAEKVLGDAGMVNYGSFHKLRTAHGMLHRP